MNDINFLKLPLPSLSYKSIYCVINLYTSLQRAYVRFHLKNYYDYSLPEYTFLGSPDWSQNIHSNNTYMIWFMQYKKLKSSNLTQIDAKTLVMDLTSILSLIPGLRDENNVKYKNHFQLRKYKRLNMHKWETLDLGTIKKLKKKCWNEWVKGMKY